MSMTAVTNVPADTPPADELVRRGPGRDGEPPGGGYRDSRDDLRLDTHGQARAAREVLRWPGGGSAAELRGDDRRPATGGGEQPAGPRRQTARAAGLRVGRSQP